MVFPKLREAAPNFFALGAVLEREKQRLEEEISAADVAPPVQVAIKDIMAIEGPSAYF